MGMGSCMMAGGNAWQCTAKCRDHNVGYVASSVGPSSIRPPRQCSTSRRLLEAATAEVDGVAAAAAVEGGAGGGAW